MKNIKDPVNNHLNRFILLAPKLFLTLNLINISIT